MRLHVTLALLGVLFPKALALKCYQCIPELYKTCKETQADCPDQCASKTIFMNTDGDKQEINTKNCAKAKECVSGSLNLGFIKMTVNSKCCNSELCNSQKVPVLPQGRPNGLKCYTCTDKDCSQTVNCEGDQDRCITSTVNSSGVQLTMKGCGNKDLCRGDAFSSEEAGLVGDMSCCEGNFCNSAKC
uniref:UPAR/Ly6 domain-containing protein n=1 Tax=Pygocentrus nattereri TaxID=42514 RepID=A0A3B4D1S8_PYGNA